MAIITVLISATVLAAWPMLEGSQDERDDA